MVFTSPVRCVLEFSVLAIHTGILPFPMLFLILKCINVYVSVRYFELW